jgi:hypothetical protein
MSEMIAGRRTITAGPKQTVVFQITTSKYLLAKIALNCRFSSSQNSTSYKFATSTMHISKRRNKFQQIKMAYY